MHKQEVSGRSVYVASIVYSPLMLGRQLRGFLEINGTRESFSSPTFHIFKTSCVYGENICKSITDW
jgi:hypothetical protein